MTVRDRILINAETVWYLCRLLWRHRFNLEHVTFHVNAELTHLRDQAEAEMVEG